MSYDIGCPRLKLEPLEMLMGAMHHMGDVAWDDSQAYLGVGTNSNIIIYHQYLHQYPINDIIGARDAF